MWIVFTETESGRWYWGSWGDFSKASEVANELQQSDGIVRGVCRAEDALLYNVQNLPAWMEGR